MLEILQYLVGQLTTDSTLNAIVPIKNVFVGPVDIVEEKQNGLYIPQINIHAINETSRSVPSNTRDTLIQIDIWSRNNQMEVETIYERIITLLNYNIANEGTAHIFWERLDSAVDQNESDRRIWHRAITYKVWTQKP